MHRGAHIAERRNHEPIISLLARFNPDWLYSAGGPVWVQAMTFGGASEPQNLCDGETMSVNAETLGKLVVALTTQGNLVAVGQMVIYAEEPTIGIRLPDGTLIHWQAALAREATADETAIVQKLAPAQNDCDHKQTGRLTWTTNALVCARCRKTVSE
jgi:hypothetical protein